MKIKITAILIVITAILTAVVMDDPSIIPSDYQPKSIKNTTVIPEKSVGNISKKSSLSDLQKAFGKGNVVDMEIDGGNYEYKNGTRILTKDEPIDIIWKDVYFTNPWRVVIADENSKFTIEDKIKIGTPIAEVVKLNKKDFFIEGFNGTDKVMNVTWNGGELSKNLILEFKPIKLENTKNLELNPDHNRFVTSDEKIQKLELVVTKIIIEW